MEERICPESLNLRFVSEIESEPDRDRIEHVRSVFRELGLDSFATPLDCKVTRYICECVSSRAADLSGAGVAALINKVHEGVSKKQNWFLSSLVGPWKDALRGFEEGQWHSLHNVLSGWPPPARLQN